MKGISARILCKDCPKCNLKVISEGEKFDVEYIVLEPEERYLIRDNPNISWNDVMEKMNLFQDMYVPKFGKYEIEEFISYFLKEALLITKDITNLFNMEILCDDYPYNTTRVSSKKIKEKLMEHFNVLEKKGNTVYLMFKWNK